MTTKTTSSLSITSTSTSRLERGLVDLHTNGHLATIRVEGLLTHDSRNGTDRGVVRVAIIPRGSARGYHVRLSASVASYGRTVVEAMDHLLTWEEVPGVWAMRDETITGSVAKGAFRDAGLNGSRLTEESHAYFSARTLKDVAEVLRHLTAPKVLLRGLETVAPEDAAEPTEDAVLMAAASALEWAAECDSPTQQGATALDILTGTFGPTTAKGILARLETPTPTVACLRHALDITRAAERNAEATLARLRPAL